MEILLNYGVIKCQGNVRYPSYLTVHYLNDLGHLVNFSVVAVTCPQRLERVSFCPCYEMCSHSHQLMLHSRHEEQ